MGRGSDPDAIAQRFVAIATEAADRLGVFAALAAPQPLDVLAATLSLPLRRLRSLVELLIAGGRLVREGGTLGIGVAGAREAAGASVIVEVVGRDRAVDTTDRWSLQLDARELQIAPLLSVGAAAQAIEVIAPRVGEGVLLDAGGGHGDATRAFLMRVPHGRVILVDVPGVIAAARQRLADLADRIEFVPGDLRGDPLPPCRAALISNVLHLHRPEACAAIIENVTRTLEDGGTLAVKDIALDAEREGPLRSLAVALATQVFSNDGEIYTAPQIVSWLEASGLTAVRAHVLAGAPECALVTGVRTTR